MIWSKTNYKFSALKVGDYVFKKRPKLTIISSSKVKIQFKLEEGYSSFKFHYYCNNHSTQTLAYKQFPLAQMYFQYEYYCVETSERILRSAYSTSELKDLHPPKLNDLDFNSSIETVYSEIIPILHLLNSGIYILEMETLDPTDGNEHLFWDILNNGNSAIGSAKTVRWDDYSGYPHYIPTKNKHLVATQSKSFYNQERVSYYRENNIGIPLCINLSGGINAVIDGHHKILAAALDRRSIRCAVLYIATNYGKNVQKQEYYAYIDEQYHISKQEYHWAAKLNKSKQKSSFNILNGHDCGVLPFNTHELAKYYPTAYEYAVKDFLKEYTRCEINRIIDNCCYNNEDEVYRLLEYFSCTKSRTLLAYLPELIHKELSNRSLLMLLKAIEKANMVDECTVILTELLIKIEWDKPEIAKKIKNII